MRIAVLTAALLLAAGCSSAPTPTPSLTPIPPKATVGAAPSPTSTPSRTPLTSATSAAPSAPPAASTPIKAAIAWVGAGVPADPGAFHTATRDGVVTQLGEDVAFVTPSGTTKCMTAAAAGGALACLVELADPPKQPADVYGQWIGGWVDFGGGDLGIGSAHADPGRFSTGIGAELPYGRSLRFGDYQCRSEEAGLFCVNFAHLSGAKFAGTGVEPLGCLKRSDDPDVGLKFSC